MRHICDACIRCLNSAETTVAHAKVEEAYRITMIRRGLGPACGLLMGSVSHEVAHLSECACMTVV